MRKLLPSLLIVLSLCGTVYAAPTLQLDILGGTYNGSTQTIMAGGDSFRLYAYLIPDRFNPITDTYYISAAVVPRTGPVGANLGFFVFGGRTINATSNMTYGVPPIESSQGWDNGDLSRHGIYETYFSQIGFQFAGDQIAAYDTQERAISGSLIPTSGTGMYYAAFQVDVRDLADGYAIHFDLYNTNMTGSDVDVDGTKYAAPFSHDAESDSNPVPEPATIILLGSGLAGLGFWRKKRGGRS